MMDFIDQLKKLSEQVDQLKDNIQTEEATKTAFIMPFFQLLGYNIFNPAEFIPEYVADVGLKKDEKVDYAILKDGKPIILIEAKWCGENLQKYDSQLFRYFGTTTAKFAILTNGIEYRFYTDLDAPNKMDEKPFLEINILDLKDSIVNELKKFRKENFDQETIFNTASELKYSNQIKQFFAQQLTNPTDQFVAFILKEIYQGRKTQNVIDKFKGIIKKSLNQFINELMNDRIKAVIESNSKVEDKESQDKSQETKEENVSKIQTTMEELEGFFIIKSLLREIISPDKITYKDTKSYFGILLENNTWKWICRLYLSGNQKYIIIPDENKNQLSYPIKNVNDIYQFKDELTEVMKRYL